LKGIVFMSKREDTAIIQDIKEAIDRIMAYTSNMEYDDFLDEVIRNIEILGEAAKLISDETKENTFFNKLHRTGH